MWERQFLQVGDTFRFFAATFFAQVSRSERLPARLRLLKNSTLPTGGVITTKHTVLHMPRIVTAFFEDFP